MFVGVAPVAAAAQQPLSPEQGQTSFSIQPPYDGSDTVLSGCTDCGHVEADAATGSVTVDVTSLNRYSDPRCVVRGRVVPRPGLETCGAAFVGCGSSPTVRAEGSVIGRHDLASPASSLRLSTPIDIGAGLVVTTDPCGAASASPLGAWSFTVVAECGVLDEAGHVTPATRRSCSASSSTREWLGPAAPIVPEQAVLTADLQPPAGEVVAPGPVTVRVSLSGWARAARATIRSPALRVSEKVGMTRLDLSGTVTRIDGTAGASQRPPTTPAAERR